MGPQPGGAGDLNRGQASVRSRTTDSESSRPLSALPTAWAPLLRISASTPRAAVALLLLSSDPAQSAGSAARRRHGSMASLPREVEECHRQDDRRPETDPEQAEMDVE
jgi:hypothetical protein